MKSNVSGISSLVLVLVAFSSLVSMFALTRIDNIVHRDLYRYGLTFSYEWAMSYWTMTTVVFAMGWFNIIIACAFQLYVLVYGRKKAEVIPQKVALKPKTAPQPPIEEKPAEAAEAERKETIARAMEVELETRREDEEAQKPSEEPVIVVEEKREEAQRPVEEITPQEYIETEQPEEVEEQREREAEPKFEEQEPVDAGFQEETSYTEEEEREQEEVPGEPVETETQEPSQPAPEIDVEGKEREEPQTQTFVPSEEHEAPTEEIQQQEADSTESYPT